MHFNKYIKYVSGLVRQVVIYLPFIYLPLKAQQNLFNVPSGDITEKGHLFFQHQINANEFIQNNSTLTYGIGKKTELGVNLYGLDIQKNTNGWKLIKNQNNYTQPLNPQLLINIQKAFIISKRFNLSIGTQTGLSLTQRQREDQFIYFNYAILKYTAKNERLKWITGVYFGDKTYLGEGNNTGYMGGIEYSLSRKFKLSADAIYGNNASSVSVIGPCYFITKHFALSAGWQRPFKYSHNSQAIVLELTFL